jgi:hypothetical protein
VIHLQPTLKIIWKELALLIRRYLQVGKQNFVRSVVRMLRRITSTRIISLGNTVDGKEGSFSFNKKAANANAAVTPRIKLH